MIKTFQDLFRKLEQEKHEAYTLFSKYAAYKDSCAHMYLWIHGETDTDYNHQAALLWRELYGALTGLQIVGFIEEEEKDALADELKRMFEEGCDA